MTAEKPMTADSTYEYELIDISFEQSYELSEEVPYSITVPSPEIPFVDEASIIKKGSKNKKRKKRP